MKRVVALFLSLLSAFPIVSAQFGFGYGYLPSPSQWLENEYLVFIIFFAIFFAIIHLSLSRVFSGNPMPSIIIAAALSFLIAASMQRNWYFLEKPILLWALFLIIALVILVVVKAFMGGIGIRGLLIAIALLVGLWPFIKSVAPYEAMSALPYGLTSFLDVIWFWALLLFAILAIIGYKLWGYHRAVQRGRAPWLSR